MLGDTDAACMTIALALCLTKKTNHRWTKEGTNEDHNTHTKILRETYKVEGTKRLQNSFAVS